MVAPECFYLEALLPQFECGTDFLAVDGKTAVDTVWLREVLGMTSLRGREAVAHPWQALDPPVDLVRSRSPGVRAAWTGPTWDNPARPDA